MKKMRILITLLFITANANLVNATEQEKERLIYGSDTCLILETPLDSILGQGRSKRFDIEKTSLWRGYVGTWQIRDTNLFLIDIKAKQNGKELTITDVFNEINEINANWYSGILTIFATTKYYPLYPHRKDVNKIELKIIEGKVINIQDIKNKNITEYLKLDINNKNLKEKKKSAPEKKY